MWFAQSGERRKIDKVVAATLCSKRDPREGSRGEPEKLSLFKKGVGHLAKARPQTAVHPLFMHGLGKALPKDSWILVPFNCDVVVGEAFYWNDSMDVFMVSLQERMTALAAQVHVAPWD